MIQTQRPEAKPPMALDAELLGPGEGERTAGLRLVKRVLQEHPFIEVFSMDALYLEAPILRAIVEAGRGAIVVLKEERRELYQDVQALLPTLEAREEVLEKELPALKAMSLLGLARMLLEYPPAPSEISIWAWAEGP